MERTRRWAIDSKGALNSAESALSQITPGQVVVHLHAACLLPSDSCKSGYSFSGTVLSSYDTSPWSIGARVWGFCADQEISERVVVPEWAIHKLKTNLSFMENATLAGPALLACHALQIAALPGSGKPRVLVHGGHTAIGTFAIQAARVMKCEVEATVPLQYRDECKDLGAHEFVDLQDDVSHGVTLASFRGRRERNFHLVIDTLADDPSIYDNIEKFTHENSRYVTIKERSVSWGGFLKRIATSVPRNYYYLTNPLTASNAAKQLELVSNILGHPEFVRVEVQDEYAIEDLPVAAKAADSPEGLGCVVVELSGVDSNDFQDTLTVARNLGPLVTPGVRASKDSAIATSSASKTKERSRKESLTQADSAFSIE